MSYNLSIINNLESWGFVGKAPYRISLLGGGSDLVWFVKDNNYGTCFGYSLEKFSYSVLNILPSAASKGILEYSTRENYSSLGELGGA